MNIKTLISKWIS